MVGTAQTRLCPPYSNFVVAGLDPATYPLRNNILAMIDARVRARA
jgi:hypothetical protein